MIAKYTRRALSGEIVEQREIEFTSRKIGLGDMIEKAAKPIAKALKLKCLDENGNLKPESGCGKRKAWLNKTFSAAGSQRHRNEIVLDLYPEIGWLSINRYGAVCLNSMHVMFADVDKVPPDTIDYAVDYCANNFGLGFRQYKTAAGYRLIEVSRLFDPRAKDVARIFKALRVDSLFSTLTRSGNNFRARLTPKPVRAGDEVRFTTGRQVQEYLDAPKWRIAEYMRDSGVAPSPLDPEIEKIVSLHDEFCLVNSSLPLA